MAKTSGVEVKDYVQKSALNRLVSAVTFRPCILKMAISFFLVHSISSRGAFLIAARPPSGYNPMFSM